MISTIRKGLNKKYARAIVWILLLALFGLPSVLSIFKRFTQPDIQSIAVVNGQPIGLAAYKQKIAEEERRLQFFKQFGAQAEELLRSLGITGTPHERALNELIQEALIHTNAQGLSIQISSDYIAQKMQDPSFLLQSLSSVIPPQLFSSTGALDFQTLARYLQRQGISMAAFEELVKDALYKDIIFKLVHGATYVTDAELLEAYRQEYSNKKFALFPFSRAAALQAVKKEIPSDDVLKQFFAAQNTHAKRYWVPEKRTITRWTFEPSTYGITITEKEIKQAYGKNKELYKDKDLAAATPAIKEALLQEKFKRLFNLDAQRIIAGSAHDESLFSTFITNKKALASHTAIEQDYSPVARKAFTLAAGKKGFILEDKKGAIIQVDNIEKAYLPDFITIKNTVLRDYYDDQAQKYLEKELMALQSGTDTHQKEERTTWLNPQKPETTDVLRKKGLPVDRMMRMTHIGDFIDAFTADTAYAIRLIEIEPIDQEAYKVQREALRKKLITQKAQLISQAFVASLQKNATIVINKTV